MPEFVCSNNSRQNIWNKVEKYSDNAQDSKILTYTFWYFVTAIAKISFLEGRLGSRLCFH